MTLAQTLDRANRVRGDIRSAIKGPVIIEDHRSQLVMGYLSLALEHQEGIVTLIRNHLRGSALALVRPVFEIFYRTFWVCQAGRCRKDLKDNFDFPSIGKMVSDIDAIVGDGMFENIKRSGRGLARRSEGQA